MKDIKNDKVHLKVHIDTSDLDEAKDKAERLVSLLNEARSVINGLASAELIDLDNVEVQ